MRGAIVVGVCVLLLAGCASSSDNMDVSGSATASPTVVSQAAKDDATCRSYGTFPGTTPYVQCRLGLKKMEEDRAGSGSILDELFSD